MSDENDDSDKTEDPSAKRLDEARSKGQVPQSKEINHWFIILAAGIIVTMMMPSSASRLYQALIGFWEHPHSYQIDQDHLGSLLVSLCYHTMLAMLVPFLLLIVSAFLAGVIQFGLLFSPEALEPKLERISIIKGFGRIFSMRSVIELVKGMIKISIIGSILFSVMYPIYFDSPNFISYSMSNLLQLIQSLAGRLLMVTVSIITVVAAADWLYQRFSFMQQMRMSKQDLKEEYRQSEGDPIVKQRQRQIRADKARKRMMAAVPKSTVVVTNPTHYAIALLYEQNKMLAPKVVAKGVDAVALRIRKLAEENNVPIMENPPLARSLYASVEIDEEIPGDYYKAVAEVISFVFRLRKRPQ